MLRFLRHASSNGQGNVGSGDLLVAQHGTPNMSVDLAVGEVVIAYQDYCYYGWIDATYNLTISTADPSNPRIDAIVAYIDLSVVSSASNNNPNALKFMDVAGTPAGSPSAPSGTAIQTAVGAGNPYYVLANVRVNAGVTSVVSANITDLRSQYVMGASNSGKLQSVQQTTTFTNSSTSSASDVEMMSVTFTPTATANLVVMVSVVWQQSGAASGYGDIQLDSVVQGNSPAIYTDFAGAGIRHTVAAQQYISSVSVASHKVSVNYHTPGGTGTITPVFATLTVLVYNA